MSSADAPAATPDERALRAEIVEVGRLLYDRGLVVATDGNISARLAADRFLATPNGLCKGRMTPDQLIVVDARGRRVDRPTAANAALRPTSEIHMHLEAYSRRPDIGAVVHAHPPHAIALSIAGIPLGRCVLPEAIVFLGLPPTAPYGTPSSPEGAAAIRAAIAGHDALVLARHGSLAVGASPFGAYYNTETLEQLARITFMLRLLGADASGGDISGAISPSIDAAQPGAARPDVALAPDQITRLLATREQLGLMRAGEAEEFCAMCGVCHADGRHVDTSGDRPAPERMAGINPNRVREIVARVVAELGLVP